MNITDFLTQTAPGLVLVFTPFILAIVQIMKGLITNSKWYPVISVGLGIIMAVPFVTEYDLAYRILVGVMAGLTASGVYSTQSTIRK